MAQVTFYKSGFNRENRAYNLGALNGVLEGAMKCNVGVGNVNILPNVPFAVSSATITSGEVGKSPVKLMTEGYDYISFTTGNVTWYAFIDSIQAIAVGSSTEGLNIFVEHTVDYWATYLANGSLATNFHMHGNVERAHVNDLVGIYTAGEPSGSAYIDMSNTTGTTEAPYNTMLIKKERSILADPLLNSSYYYLYIYIANPEEVGINLTAENQAWFPLMTQETPQYQCVSDGGICLVYPVIRDGARLYLVYRTNYDTPTDDSDYGLFPIQALTSSAIKSMTLSKISPVSGLGTAFDERIWGMQEYTINGITFPSWTANYLNNANNSIYQFNVKQPDPNIGLPPYLNWFTRMSMLEENQSYLTTYTGSNGRVNIATTFDDYLATIPKMLSRIYNPLYIADDIYPAEDGTFHEVPEIAISVGYTPDLKYLCIYYKDDYFIGTSKRKLIPNKAVYASNVTIDYWTRLNAEQMGIQAQQSTFNAVSNAVTATVGAATSVGLAAVSGGMSQSVQIGRAGGATGSLLGAGQSIGNAVYAIQAANNLQQIADRQYNCGDTTAFNTQGMFNSFYNETENFLTRFSCEEQYKVIAPNLHRYGYNTFLEIDEIYANHRREAFNYFKGVNVTVGGLPNEWCNAIAEMFNNGVTLWSSSDIGDYNQINYQVNLWTQS